MGKSYLFLYVPSSREAGLDSRRNLRITAPQTAVFPEIQPRLFLFFFLDVEHNTLQRHQTSTLPLPASPGSFSQRDFAECRWNKFLSTSWTDHLCSSKPGLFLSSSCSSNGKQRCNSSYFGESVVYHNTRGNPLLIPMLLTDFV